MKAGLYFGIMTLVVVRNDFRVASDIIIPAGTEGCVVECYKDPERYAVDLAIPNKNSISGYDYENVLLYPDQFEVVRTYSEEGS